MAKKKLQHFAENLTFKHLVQKSWHDLQQGFDLKGNWCRDYFQNNHPITLELGCGKGEYTVNLALKYPERNFVGIDIKGARLWKGCKLVEEHGIRNVAFIRSRIDWIVELFGPEEVDEIWITFPDPQPQTGRVSKRLTSPAFLERYHKVIKPSGLIHLKTDNRGLYDYTLEVIRLEGHRLVFASDDIYCAENEHEATAIQTFYEEKYRQDGVPIKYLEFTLNYARG